MPKTRFEIDPNNLDKSAEAAFKAHTDRRLGYEEWKAVAQRIEHLRGIDAFRQHHGEALHDEQHPDHAKRADELQALYETAYPNDPASGS